MAAAAPEGTAMVSGEAVKTVLLIFKNPAAIAVAFHTSEYSLGLPVVVYDAVVAAVPAQTGNGVKLEIVTGGTISVHPLFGYNAVPMASHQTEFPLILNAQLLL